MKLPKLFVRGVLLLIVLLLAALALGLALAWAPDRPVQELVKQWAPPPSTFVDVKGLKVHLRDEGTRTDPLPVVLIHGTSASLHTWGRLGRRAEARAPGNHDGSARIRTDRAECAA